eukprot:62211-Prorocentrum_lima.AAC.1
MTSSLVGSEMCIRDSFNGKNLDRLSEHDWQQLEALGFPCNNLREKCCSCLLYTSDAADDM